jgi:hypothetical protein
LNFFNYRLQVIVYSLNQIMCDYIFFACRAMLHIFQQGENSSQTHIYILFLYYEKINNCAESSLFFNFSVLYICVYAARSCIFLINVKYLCWILLCARLNEKIMQKKIIFYSSSKTREIIKEKRKQ